MTILRPAFVLIFVSLLMIAPRTYGTPLSSCSDIGKSSGGYTITGTTYRICAGCSDGETTADVNALALKRGDAVLFKAGEIFHIGTEANRLKLKSGVLYGRYGSGANPIITANGILFGVRFRGVVDLEGGGSNITIDGIDVHGGTDENFNIFMRDVSTATISNLTVTNGNGGGIGFERGADVVVDRVVLSGLPGRPHESLTFDGTNGYVVSNVRSTGGGHAAINNKGNARNGEIFGSEFSSTNNDPTFYIERGENIHVHDNWIHTNSGSSTKKALFSLGIEKFGDPTKHYVRDIKINNNIIENAERTGMKFFLKETIADDPGRAERLYDNIHIHNNTIVGTGQEGLSWSSAIRVSDNRSPPDPDDWSNIVFENNVIWDTGVADAMEFTSGVERAFTIRNNLYQSGETGYLGANAITTSRAPFVDPANKNFDPAGAALRAGNDGSDVGAAINWSCDTSARKSQSRPMPPQLSAQ